MKAKGIVVAIDGPAGGGKSTVSRRVAQDLNYVLVDTGAIYRVVALAATHQGLAWEDGDALGRLARELAEGSAIRFQSGGEQSRIFLGSREVTQAIRTPEISDGASRVSAHPAVREALLELQREAGRDGGVVLEGRDIGTVVFPEAEAKFFLTASSEVRAKRRHQELLRRGVSIGLEQVKRDVFERDQRDASRDVAPLKAAPDALEVDSSELSIDEVVARIVKAVKLILAQGNH